MKPKHYNICKRTNDGGLVILNVDTIKGFDITPKNSIKYDGIVVNKMVIVNPSFVEKIVKRKIKLKLEKYLKLIISLIDDDSSGDAYREALNDLTRYKSILDHKYKKYLDERYLNVLMKKIQVVEYELKSKILCADTIGTHKARR